MNHNSYLNYMQQSNSLKLANSFAEMKIHDLGAQEILDSRGNPTVAVWVRSGDKIAWAQVPSGASTGSAEACELRDSFDQRRYHGKGVLQAVANIKQEIRPALLAKAPYIWMQAEIDAWLCELDGTPNKSRLGANAILGVSLAVAKLAGQFQAWPLYRYIRHLWQASLSIHTNEDLGFILPRPMVNVINGGAHADNGLDIQEFMLVPLKTDLSFAEQLRQTAEVFQQLKSLLKQAGLSTGVGDEGGFAPKLTNGQEALDLIMAAIRACGYEPGVDLSLALDVAATELYDVNTKLYTGALTSEQWVAYLLQLAQDYPIVSIEDGLAEQDYAGWQMLTQQTPAGLQLVGDDLFVTNTQYLQMGIDQGLANAILIKMNQIGTLTETLATIRLAQQHGYKCIISHRSGETEDVSIADLAVAVNAEMIKAGSTCRGERVAKYNRLLQIEAELKPVKY